MRGVELEIPRVTCHVTRANAFNLKAQDTLGFIKPARVYDLLQPFARISFGHPAH